MEIIRFIIEIFKLRNPFEFLKLAFIGGHKVYHLEGNALYHTYLVWKEAKKRFLKEEEKFMIKVALLHDVGKIYTSIRHGKNDWEYPNHAESGAVNLYKFVSKSDPFYYTYQWYIRNHIKPLFWRYDCFDGFIVKTTDATSVHCKPYLLAELAVCDIIGSKCIPEKKEEQKGRMWQLLGFASDFDSHIFA